MNDRDLKDLFHAAGRLAPRRDLSEQVMAQVAVTRIAEPTAVPPLIGKAGWIAIGLGAIVVLLLALSASGGSTAGDALPWAPAVEWFTRLQLPTGQWPQWLIGASVLALFFALLSRRAEQRMAI